MSIVVSTTLKLVCCQTNFADVLWWVCMGGGYKCKV